MTFKHDSDVYIILTSKNGMLYIIMTDCMYSCIWDIAVAWWYDNWLYVLYLCIVAYEIMRLHGVYTCMIMYCMYV